jgi:hypothetical protein
MLLICHAALLVAWTHQPVEEPDKQNGFFDSYV